MQTFYAATQKHHTHIDISFSYLECFSARLQPLPGCVPDTTMGSNTLSCGETVSVERVGGRPSEGCGTRTLFATNLNDFDIVC